MKQMSFCDTKKGFPLSWQKTPTQGLEMAAWLFHARTQDLDTVIRIGRVRERFSNNPLGVYGILEDLYTPVFRQMPTAARKIMDEVCLSYFRGVRMNELAKIIFASQNSCSATVGKMARLGIISTSRSGRATIVRQTDEDFLQFVAIYGDRNRFSQWVQRVGVENVTMDNMKDYMREVSEGTH